jgi:hypothetical protein
MGTLGALLTSGQTVKAVVGAACKLVRLEVSMVDAKATMSKRGDRFMVTPDRGSSLGKFHLHACSLGWLGESTTHF